jgi:hypothetical protein
MGIFGAQGITVHGGIIQRRDIYGGIDILSQNLSQAVQNRLPFGLEDVYITQNLLEGFFYRDHTRNSQDGIIDYLCRHTNFPAIPIQIEEKSSIR